MGNKMKRFLSMALVLAMLSTNSLTALATESVESTQTETHAATTVSTEEANTSAGAKNETTGETYKSVADALDAASEGDTVILLKDEEASVVSVIEDVTLDLNGHTLEASYVTCFGNIVDESDGNTGLLKVETKRFLIQDKNEQLPVKNGEGYQFFKVEKFNKAWDKEKAKYAFQPCVESSALDLIMQGTEVTGVTVNVRVSWTQGDGLRTQDFTYNDEMANKFFGSYNSETGKFGQMFTLVLNGTAAFEELTFCAVLVSDTGVEIASEPITVDTKDDTQNPDDTGKPGDTENPGNTGSSDVTTDENNKVTGDVQIEAGQASANVSAGTQLDENTNELKLTVKEMEVSDNTIEVEEKEEVRSVDVHVDGVAENNTVPIIITVDEFAPEFLNQGNIRLYHVEDGAPVEMTRVFSLEEVDEHNEYYYDPATGIVTMALATFSEVAVVADTTKAWEGKFDYTWYDANKTELTIANADQLAGFGAIVGGMNDGATPGEGDSFAGKTVKLLADINLGDAEDGNDSKLIFYPIGYYNSSGGYERNNTSVTSSVNSFEGTFDGNGHTISNFYQNTWEMFGDYNDGYSAGSNYYKDAMGLFGYVYNGTVKNLTVNNFKSDGEFTPTGVIAAYADGDTNFENIAITNCNPRVYNTGNGGIIGIAGDTSKANDDHITLKNITVDNSNIISALWGSWDVACGGLVGMYRGNVDGNGNATGDTISFNNCHVSAQIDVYNDVCANYQYYAYRYAGMIIGSVRHNTTNNEGKTIPNMTGVSATGCTVNYGDWNDYYYCEFEKNSMASYSEDYQFSRVPHSELNFTDSNGNGVVDANERASVIGCKHTHTVEENHQAIYLPFHQLFTGYSWGVSSIGLENYSGIVTNLDITEGDQEESVDKFNGINKEEVSNNVAIKAADLFTYVKECEVEVDNTAFHMGITDLDDSDGDVTAEFERGATWEESTITLTGTGRIKITAQDYHFCNPCSIEVNVTDRQPEEKFEVAFDHDPNTEGNQNNIGKYLYRVGNQNEIAIGSLFEAKDGIAIGDVSVTVTDKSLTNISDTYTPNTTWENGTIEFEGTGIVEVTITDTSDNYCIPTVLHLEVVDATNLTSAKGTTSGGNFVLLNDVNTSGYMYYWNSILYGNGFTYSLKGAPTNYNSSHGHGILITKNATLDNVVIVGDVYDEYGAYTNNNDYNAAIDVMEDTVIQNCYISGCSAPVLARANTVIADTTLYGGTVANLIIRGGTVTLENVTTANYNDGRSLVGMGIVIHEDASDNTKVVLNGTLKQYNFLYEDDKPEDTNALLIHKNIFSEECEKYHFGEQPYRYANAGILSMSKNFTTDDLDANPEHFTTKGYEEATITNSLETTNFIYSILNSSGNVDNSYSEGSDKHKASVQGDYLSVFAFDLGDQVISYDGDDDNRYLYGDENGVDALYREGDDGITIDLTKVATAYKYGNKQLSISAVCKDSAGNEIGSNGEVTLSEAGEYILEFTVEDNIFYDTKGNAISKNVKRIYEVPLTLDVKEANIPNATITISKTALDGVYTTVNVTDYKLRINFLDCITVKEYGDNDVATEVNLSSNISSATLTPASVNVFTTASTITIKYTDGRELIVNLSKISGSSPGTKTATVNTSGSVYFITDGALNNKPTEASSQNICTITSVSFKGNNGATVTNDTDVTVTWALGTSSSTNPCVTPDTLVTLADGSQKRIDEVTYEDQLKVWNFYEGKYDISSAAIIFDHGYDNNTVIKLKFADGTEVKVVNLHQFFDTTSNCFVDITEDTVESYVGHEFVKQNGKINKSIELVDYEVTKEYVEAFGIISSKHYNILVEGMLSTDFEIEDKPLFNYFEVGDNFVFDSDKMQAEIEKYGLYSYEDFKNYLNEEQFEAFNVKYMKVSVGKGSYTYEGILALIDEYLK